MTGPGRVALVGLCNGLSLLGAWLLLVSFTPLTQ